VKTWPARSFDRNNATIGAMVATIIFIEFTEFTEADTENTAGRQQQAFAV